MRAERPILLRFLNVLTSLNDFIIKRIVFLFFVKYIASGTLKSNTTCFYNHLLALFLFLRQYQPKKPHMVCDCVIFARISVQVQR